MPAPLLTPDARDLRLLARPPWQRRMVAWSLPLGAAVLTAVHAAAIGPLACTPAAPCRPDVAGSVMIGVLFASAACGFVRPGLAPWLAGSFLVTEVVAERLLRTSLPSPAWMYVVDLAYAGLCLAIAGVGRERRPTPRAAAWLAGVRHERAPVPSAGDLPRPGRGWRAVGTGLLVLAAGSAVWGWYAQDRVDAQQRAAARVGADVTAVPDELSVAVRLPGGEQTTVAVLDAHRYAVGQRFELYVDDRGLRQPVAQPYDASGWYLLAVLLGGTGLAGRLRAAGEARRPRRLFAEEQPVTEVTVLPGHGVLAVYAGDARPGEPAVAEFRTDAVRLDATGSDDGRLVGLDLEPGPQPATLYGVPVPGRWCTAVVGGRTVVPTRPVSTRVDAPPFGFHADLGDRHEDGPDATLRSLLPADPPVRAEDLAALRPIDRDADRHEVRLHVRHPATGYASAVGLPLILISVARLLPAFPYGVALVVAGLAVAGSSALAWRLFMRSRVAWNRRGVAIVGAIGIKRVPWRMVRSIEHGDDHVTIHTGYSGLVVGAGPFLGVIGRGGRSAIELATALRHARACADDPDPGAVGRSDLPDLAVPRPPGGLVALGLLYTPVLAWLLQVFSSS